MLNLVRPIVPLGDTFDSACYERFIVKYFAQGSRMYLLCHCSLLSIDEITTSDNSVRKFSNRWDEGRASGVHVRMLMLLSFTTPLPTKAISSDEHNAPTNFRHPL